MKKNLVWVFVLCSVSTIVSANQTTQSSFGVSLVVKESALVSAPNKHDQQVLMWFPQDARPQSLQSLGVASLDQLNDAQLRPYSMEALLKGPQAQEVAEFMSTHGERFHPYSLLSLSHYFLRQNDPKRALFWYYAFQFRGSFDALRASDDQAGKRFFVLKQTAKAQDLSLLAQQEKDLARYAAQNAFAWDGLSPCAYHPLWLSDRPQDSSPAFLDQTPQHCALLPLDQAWAQANRQGVLKEVLSGL